MQTKHRCGPALGAMIAAGLLGGCSSATGPAATRTVTSVRTVTVTAAPPVSTPPATTPVSTAPSSAAATPSGGPVSITGDYPHSVACRTLTTAEAAGIAKFAVARAVSAGHSSPNYDETSCDWVLVPLPDCNCGDVSVSVSAYHSAATPDVYRNQIKAEIKAGTAKPIPGVPDSAYQALNLEGFALIVHRDAEIEIRVRLSYTYSAVDASAIAEVVALALPRIDAANPR